MIDKYLVRVSLYYRLEGCTSVLVPVQHAEAECADEAAANALYQDLLKQMPAKEGKVNASK